MRLRPAPIAALWPLADPFFRIRAGGDVEQALVRLMTAGAMQPFPLQWAPRGACFSSAASWSRRNGAGRSSATGCPW